MDKLKEMIAYTLKKYPYKDELSNARVTKIIYLADWYSSINHHCQLTDISWVYDNYGPFVWDIKNKTEEFPEVFNIKRTTNMFGGDKVLLSLVDEDYEPDVDEKQRDALKRIIKITKKLNWSEFINVVYSTYPIASSDRYSKLDLVSKAEEYQSVNNS